MLFQHHRHVLKIRHDVFGGPSEPALQRPVHHVIVEQHHEEHRHQAQAQCAGNQLGADAGTEAVSPALHPEFEHDAHQHEAERHHEQEDQQGEAEENEGLFGVFRTEFAEVERALPDDQRGGGEQQNCGQSVQQSFRHGMSSV